MSCHEDRDLERRRLLLLAPAMILANVLLFSGFILLAAGGLNGGRGLGIIPLGESPSHQVVEDYLAARIPRDRYRIREWYPPKPLAAPSGRSATDQSEPDAEAGVAQRVKLVFYGPNGARQLDTVYWVHNGRVARILPSSQTSLVREL